jgi:hypothetical protein
LASKPDRAFLNSSGAILRSTGRPVYDGRNAAAIFKQSPLVFGMKTDVGEAGEMENSPEAIVAV